MPRLRVRNPITVLAPDGAPVAGAQVHTRDVATGTDADVSQDRAGNTAGDNPAATDANGRVVQYVPRGSYASTVTAPGVFDEYVHEWEATPGSDDGIDPEWVDDDNIGGALVAVQQVDGTVQWQKVTSGELANGSVGTAQLADGSVTAAKMAAGAVPVTAVEVLETEQLAGVTQHTFSGLDGDADGVYIVEFAGAISLTGAVGRMYVRPNGDATTGAYIHAMEGRAENNTDAHEQSAGNTDGLWFGRSVGQANGTVSPIQTQMRIAAVSGRYRSALVQAVQGLNGDTPLHSHNGGAIWRNTANNIQSLLVRISSGTFTGRLRLLRA